MKSNEAIDEFFNRFKSITNELQAIEKDVTDAEMNNKVLKLLPKKWNTIIHLLEIVQDMNTLKFKST